MCIISARSKQVGHRSSDSPLDIAFLLALFGGPGLLIGAVIGALLCRRHRVIGGLTEHGS